VHLAHLPVRREVPAGTVDEPFASRIDLDDLPAQVHADLEPDRGQDRLDGRQPRIDAAGLDAINRRARKMRELGQLALAELPQPTPGRP
jgi:hypothetical protein